MARYRFYQLDVFTRTPLAGNPLAVFPHANGLDATTMQSLAREMNLSETTFVTPSATATRRVRFFTPAAEIPLAGHPTIGTWWLLAETGEIELPQAGEMRVTQETGAGVLPVDLSIAAGKVTRAVMTQAHPAFGPTVDNVAQLGTALGGDGRTVAPGPPPQVVSTALPQLMVPIRSLAHLKALPSGGSGSALTQLLRSLGTDCAMCFAMDAEMPGASVHCRMFAPGLGVIEDPATGSAAGALGAYLVRHALVKPQDGIARVTMEQGLEIGRPSIIHVEVRTDNGATPVQVRVGGEAVTVITGEVSL
ncbi:MAG TPA: PhzF family phenazine biosynthesis protein [Gemmatimonadales bacterium]|nr:PhzF family phenazine biosynthesis protein [Gemmatimonadales bacterium]